MSADVAGVISGSIIDGWPGYLSAGVLVLVVALPLFLALWVRAKARR